MLWVKNLPRLWFLEREYFDEAVAHRSKKPETICVYFSNHAPVYIHRHSTVNPRYEWLIWVNELDVYQNYEKKTWIEREQQKQEWKIYKDECWYHANVWLYRQTQEAMRNNIEWQLAETEEKEETEETENQAPLSI